LYYIRRREGAIVEAELILANLAKVAWLTHATANRIFYRAPPIEGAVVFAVLGSTVVTDEWWCALRCAESIAYTVHFSRNMPRTRDLGDVRHIHVVVCMIVSCLAGVAANLLLCVFVIIARSTWAAYITAVFAVVTYVTLAKSVHTRAMIAAIIDAMIEIEIPHIVADDGIPAVLNALGLPCRIRYSAIHDNFIGARQPHSTVACAGAGTYICQFLWQICATVCPSIAAVPAWPLAARLGNS